MKKWVSLLLVFSLSFALCACCVFHDWQEATCSAPRTCTKCGKTEGEPLGHTWTDATCTEAKTCSVCGETEGKPLGHTWIDASCTEPKTCSVCGMTEGEPSHSWVAASCTKPKTCSVCGMTEGNPLGHSWADATYTKPKTCKICGLTDGEPLPVKYFQMDSHEYVEAYNNSEHALGTLSIKENTMKISGTNLKILFFVFDVSENTSGTMWTIPKKQFNEVMIRLPISGKDQFDSDSCVLSLLIGQSFAEILDPSFDCTSFIDGCTPSSAGNKVTMTYSHNGFDYELECYPSGYGQYKDYYYDFKVFIKDNH